MSGLLSVAIFARLAWFSVSVLRTTGPQLEWRKQAYCRMGNNLKAQSDLQKLSASLEMLWEEIRVKGQRETIAMAVLGSDLARIGNASHSDLIKLIVSS